jgi:hypothetical protein
VLHRTAISVLLTIITGRGDIPARHRVAKTTRRVRRSFMFATTGRVEKLGVCRSSGGVRWWGFVGGLFI